MRRSGGNIRPLLKSILATRLELRISFSRIAIMPIFMSALIVFVRTGLEKKVNFFFFENVVNFFEIFLKI